MSGENLLTVIFLLFVSDHLKMPDALFIEWTFHGTWTIHMVQNDMLVESIFCSHLRGVSNLIHKGLVWLHAVTPTMQEDT